MPEPSPNEALTLYLRDPQGAGPDLASAVMPLIYNQLRSVARACLRGARGPADLQPTILVNEAWLKLMGDHGASVNDREHFYALAARAMRQLCVDEARARQAKKRGGNQAAVTLDDGVAAASGLPVTILDLDEALAELAELDEREARVVELRFFAGLSMQEIAAALQVSVPTVEREWRAARAWLGHRLGRAGPGPGHE